MEEKNERKSKNYAEAFPNFKVMLILFESPGLVHNEFDLETQAIKNDCYLDVLTYLLKKICQKRPR